MIQVAVAELLFAGVMVTAEMSVPTFNVAFLVGLAFAVAANLPVILMSTFWRRFTTEGAVVGADRDQSEHYGN